MPVSVSVVVRTLNEAQNLERLMEGIHEQNYKDWEIVLVDSGSTDGTLEIAQRYGCNIYHIPKEEFTFGRSLNLGCGKAQGEYLVFASGHVWPVTNNWLGNLVEPFKDPAVAMVYGRQRGTEGSRLSEIRDLSVNFGPASAVLIDEAKGNNGNAAIRRELWVHQPFDESLPGLEDVDWARKAERENYRVYYAADAAVYHFHDETLRQVYGRSLREAVATKRMFPHYRYTMADLIKGLPHFITRDILFGLRTGRRRKLLQVPATRFAHLLGIYNGVRYHKGLASKLKARLAVPRYTQSVVVDEDGNHGLKNQDLPPLGADEVLVQVAYAGVCAYDQRLANRQADHHGERPAVYPMVPGHEYSGMVIETGAKVRGLAKGQKVAGLHARDDTNGRVAEGAYTQYLVRPAKQVRRLPWDIPLSYGALAETLALCLSAIRLLEPEPGLRACVIGAGPVGNFCAQILSSKGLRVVSVDPNSRWLSLLQKYDIDTLTELGPLGRYSYLVETTGSSDEVANLVENSSPSAKILSVGTGCVPAILAADSLPKHAGKLILSPTAVLSADWGQAVKMISKGVIRLDDHAGTVKPLESYEKAWDGMASGHHFKFLLNVSEELGSL